MRKRTVLLGVTALAMASLFAEPAGFATAGFGRTLSDSTFVHRAENKNDTFGSLSPYDWDDLRSYGMYAGFGWRHWSVELNLDGLTNRAADSSERGRADLLDAYLSRSFPLPVNGLADVRLLAGLGFEYAGNLGFYSIQKVFHECCGNYRPIPTLYDAVPPTIAASLIAGVEAESRTALAPLDAFAFAALDTNLRPSVAAIGALNLLGGYTAIQAIGGFQWRAIDPSVGWTLFRTVESENGALVGLSARIADIELAFSYNLSTGRQLGSVVLTFGREKEPERPSLLSALPGIHSLEISGLPLTPSLRYRWSPIQAPVTFGPVIGIRSGNMERQEACGIPDDENYRYEQVWVGVDLGWPVLSFLDLYVASGGGIRKEQYRTRTIAASTILGERLSGVYLAELGARLYRPWKERRARDWGLAAAAGLTYQECFHPGWDWYLQIRIIGFELH